MTSTKKTIEKIQETPGWPDVWMVPSMAMTPPLDKCAAMALPVSSARLLDDAIAALRDKGVDEAQIAALRDKNAPEALARMNAERRALGLEDDILFTANSPEEMQAILDADGPPVFRGGASELMAFLNADAPCASSS